MLGSWPEKGRPERGELLEEQDVPLVEWAFVVPRVEWALVELVVGWLMWSQASGTRLIVMCAWLGRKGWRW